MPGFIVKEGRHFVSYITGPSHILLGIKFTKEPVHVQVVKEPAQGMCFHGSLDESQILAACKRFSLRIGQKVPASSRRRWSTLRMTLRAMTCTALPPIYSPSNISMEANSSMWPNPSIERTCPGKPGHAAHVERWAAHATR